MKTARRGAPDKCLAWARTVVHVTWSVRAVETADRTYTALHTHGIHGGFSNAADAHPAMGCSSGWTRTGIIIRKEEMKTAQRSVTLRMLYGHWCYKKMRLTTEQLLTLSIAERQGTVRVIRK